ncbi:MAG: glycoside hydrolase family 25 protein [Eubacterium sp.]|nr:glycoside hydrolase family 25 protein [Eubacterium sp.]
MATTTRKRKKTTSKTKRKKAKKKNTVRDNKRITVAVAVSVILLAALVSVLLFIRGSAPKGKIELSREVAEGIDVSSHNGKINWNKVSENTDFAFIRVGCRGYTQGEISKDSRADYNLKHANRNGVPVGVYFYSQAVNEKEAEEEAEFLIESIKNYNVSLPVVIDFEYPTKSGKHTGRTFEAGLSKKERTVLINAFCDRVRTAGYTPGVYASSYIYKSELIMKSIPKDVFIWVADYNESVTYNGFYDIWQYSEKGSCKGVSSKYVDKNYFYTKKRL